MQAEAAAAGEVGTPATAPSSCAPKTNRSSTDVYVPVSLERPGAAPRSNKVLCWQARAGCHMFMHLPRQPGPFTRYTNVEARNPCLFQLLAMDSWQGVRVCLHGNAADTGRCPHAIFSPASIATPTASIINADAMLSTQQLVRVGCALWGSCVQRLERKLPPPAHKQGTPLLMLRPTSQPTNGKGNITRASSTSGKWAECGQRRVWLHKV